MTEEAEKRLMEKGYFLYQGIHFRPVRKFADSDGDFYKIAGCLKRDSELGMMAGNYNGKKKHPYSYDDFYAASTDKNADVFFCLETQKEYVPCRYELQEYRKEPAIRQEREKVR